MQQDLFDGLRALVLNTELSDEEINSELENYHNSDIADVLETLTKEERLRIYNIIGVKRTSEIFEFYEDVEDYIGEVEVEKAADIIEEMDTSDAVDVLNELEEEDKTEILEAMEDEDKTRVQTVDAYDEDVIGSYMTDNYIVVNQTQSIKQAMNTMIKNAGEHDNIFTLYAVDENNKYCGAINLKDLIIARQNDVLSELVMTSYPYFYDDELMDDCINKLKDYAEDSIPVLNHDNEIVGVITGDIVIDATEEELTEDYAKLAGITDTEDLDESVFKSIKKRIPWLIILLFLGLIVSSVTGAFEGVISILPVAVFFQSMILDMAGNVGTQSLAVTIRNISSEEDKHLVRKTIGKELKIGLLNGLIISLVACAFVLLFLLIKQQEITPGAGYVFLDTLKVAGIISGSLFISMSISSLIGTAFPIFLNKVHIDPAVASGPFITTINDVVAIAVYYGLVSLTLILPTL